MELAPIILFVYNRPWHTRQTLEALSKNDLADQSTLYIFADGPKANSTNEDLKKIQDVRELVREKKWCKDVIVIEHSQNRGLVNSIIDGMTEIINRHDRAIVLEDDLLTGHGFLKFMNDGLSIYEDKQNVWSITGYMFPIEFDTVPKNILLPYVSTWGWGTWKNRWTSFMMSRKPSYQSLFESHQVVRYFNLADYNYANILKNSFNSSWGIRWYFHVFAHHGVSVFPTKSLLANIGKDGSGTNYRSKIDSIEPAIFPAIEMKRVDNVDLECWNKYLDYFTKPDKSQLRNILKYVFSKKNKIKV